MKRNWLFICLLVAGSVSAAPSSPLVGTWRMLVPGTSCTETYVFKSDGARIYTSATESGESRYTISDAPTTSGFYKFTDQIVRTNGKPDCLGQTSPEGDVVTAFIRFTEARNAFLFCTSESADTCVSPFNRVPAAP